MATPRPRPAPRRPPGWLDRLFGRPPPPAYPPDGVPRLEGPMVGEGAYLAAALGLALAVAAVLEWVVSLSPIPPGGDSGQWIAASYPYINRPYPSQVIFLGYPPLLFPVLGGLYLVGGSAPAAGRLFVALGALLLGLSTYYLARSLVRRPIIALLVEGFVLLNAPLLRLFFFGGYPTVLGLVFLQLSFGCAARWVGSYRQSMLFLAYVCVAATFLTHSLVGLLTAGTLVLCGLVMLAQRTLPRDVLFSAGGAAGATTLVGAVGGFYAYTRLAGIVHPNYLEQGALGQSKTSLNSLLYPFRLNSIPGIFGHNSVFSPAAAYALTVVFVVVLFFLIAYLAARRRLPFPVLLQGSFLIAILGAGAVGWSISIITDYRRFAYFVFIPVTLGVGWIFDYLLSVFLSVQEGDNEAPGLPPLPPRRPRRGADPITVGLAVLGVVGFVVVGATSTVPSLRSFEASYTGVSHDQGLVDAVGAIRHAGTPGSIFTDNVQANRWTRALADRNTYSPDYPTSFVFYGAQILDDERANFIAGDLYGISDGRSIAAVAALNGTYFTASPAYVPLELGVERPTLRLPPGSLTVQVARAGAPVPAFQGNRPVLLDFPVPGSAEMVLTYVEPAFNLTETIVPHAGGPGMDLHLRAVATGGSLLSAIAGNLTVPAIAVGEAVTGSGNTSQWTVPGTTGLPNVVTTATVLGRNTSAVFTSGGHGLDPQFRFQVKTAAAPVVMLNLSLSTPLASNLIPDLPPILATSQILVNWSTRYLLFDQAGASMAAYFASNFDVSLLAANPTWTVYTLPLAYPTVPIGAA